MGVVVFIVAAAAAADVNILFVVCSGRASFMVMSLGMKNILNKGF